MKYSTLSPLTYLFFVFLFNYTEAWSLDSSCTSQGADMVNAIQNAMLGAFQMAEVAERGLSGQPRNHNVQDLASWLLGPDEQEYNRVQSRFENLLGTKTKTDAPKPAFDVVVECGTSNWKSIRYRGQPGQEHMKFHHMTPEDDNWKYCAHGDPKTGKFIFALTTSNVETEISTITLCGAYLRILRDMRYKYATQLDAVIWRNLEEIKTGSPELLKPRNAMEMIDLLDCTLLHELHHTRVAAYRDMFGLDANIGEDNTDSRWAGCIEKHDPDDAQTIAFFGLAAWVNEQRDPARIVRKDGSIDIDP